MKTVIFAVLICLFSASAHSFQIGEFRIMKGLHTAHFTEGEFNEDNQFLGIQMQLFEDSRGIGYGVEYAQFINSYDVNSLGLGVYGSVEWFRYGQVAFESVVSFGLVKGYTQDNIPLPVFIADDVMIYGSHLANVVVADTFILGVRTFGNAVAVEAGIKF